MLLRALGVLHDAVTAVVPPSLREFVKFGITGAIAFVVDFSIYLALSCFGTCESTIRVFGYPLILQNLVSVLMAMLTVFLVNKFWTFRDPRTDVLASQGLRFFLFYAFTYVLNQLITSYFATYVPLLQTTFGARTDLAAKVIAVALITLVNFGGNKFIVFRGRPQPSSLGTSTLS